MARPKITVVGSFAVGLTIRAPNIPVFGVTMLGSSFDMGPGGKGSNQAVATARLGAESSLVAIIGQDKLADIATELYRVEGVDAAYIEQAAQSPTAVGFIILNERGENFIIMDYGATNRMDAAFVDRAESCIGQSDVVMAVLEVPLAAAMRAMELGRKHGKITILNPAPAAPIPDEIFPLVDYLTPNESELRILLGLRPDDPRPSRELVEMLRKRGARNVVVTLGSRGVLIVTDTIDVEIPSATVDVVDTTGAGDAFNSGFAVGLAEGRTVVDAARLGVACGALVCTKLGVIPGMATRQAADEMYRTIAAVT
ncbi:ribokinase [Mesorhizobium sp.]|uniref:ribokinase n=1 Tax=Mesorhizobium sp. TaxID=1871066 RepID=UPI000FE5F696|nr:ribokinase [Mesorhizobium sp.]RWI16592.1 MAG: ribokinase [Mesorhizobium sp.]RWN07661.1 MAG: ribokinase [Mesorhizobium sp.]RWN12420.1 MAG: ribokinase [Mesorhizobium sp.]TIQ97707.1 MAG: ribokinase [Mesorhizobium sp.]